MSRRASHGRPFRTRNVDKNFMGETNMTLVATAQEGQDTRRHHVLPNGTGYFRTNYMTSTPDVPGNPMCYLVEQDPNTTINPHYHQANQFQVFVGGDGALGKHAIAPLLVHYVDAHTPYGPIVAREDGIQYFTLREEFDPGARFLPAEIAGLKHVKRRHVTTEPVPHSAPDALTLLNGAHAEPLFEPHADGLGSWRVTAGPNATVTHDAGTCGSQFWLLLAGAATHRGRALAANAFIYVAPDEPAPNLMAGPGGSEWLIVQFPNKTFRQMDA
ncbi:MAG: hypothetical protein ACR2HE_11865 [Casimicrobiaceae bacterium]